jgi:hypothetical protein
VNAPIPTYEEFVRMALERIAMADRERRNSTVAGEHHRQVAQVYATLAAGVTPNIDLARTRVFEVIDGTPNTEVEPPTSASLLDIARMVDADQQPSDPLVFESVDDPEVRLVVEAPPTTLSQTVTVDDLSDLIEDLNGPVDPNCPAADCGHSSKAHHSTRSKADFGCTFCECPRSRERVIRVSKAIGSETL